MPYADIQKKVKSKKELAICCFCEKRWLDFPYNNKRVKRRFCSRVCLWKSNTGRPAWNKGLKGKIGDYRHSVETRRKISEAHKGEKSYNWKGGITSVNAAIRQSFEYKLWREAVFKRDNYTCVLCGISAKIVHRRVMLNADHIKKFSEYPELRLAVDNGRTLCVDCHKKTPTYGNKKEL